jgi:hypothetical protein
MKVINFSLGLIALLIVIIQIIGFTYNEEKYTKYFVKHSYFDSLSIAPDSIINYHNSTAISGDSLNRQLSQINKNYSKAKNSFSSRTNFYMKVYKAFSLATNFLYVLAGFLVIIKGIFMVRAYKKKVASEKIRNLDNLITILLRIFDIDSECRVTLFIKDKEDENKIKIFHRRYIQRENPIINYKLRFSDNEGLPGKAKVHPFIVGKEPKTEEYAEKIFINNIPDFLFKEENFKEQVKEYYRDNFNISESKFSDLSDLKYEIKSYFSVGIMCEDLKNVLVLSFDSMKENAFYDFEVFNTLISRMELTEYIYLRREVSLAKMLNSLQPENQDTNDLDDFETYYDERHEMTAFKVDPYLVYSMLKYILDLMHQSIFK